MTVGFESAMWVIVARRHIVLHAAAQGRARSRALVPKDDRRTPARCGHSVLIRPPSITKSAPVIFPERSLARKHQIGDFVGTGESSCYEASL